MSRFKMIAATALCLYCGAANMVAAQTYLDATPTPDLMQVLPPPPAAGSAGDEEDRATFRETRKLQGSDRWTVATADVTDGPLKSFACAMGMDLDAKQVPALMRVFGRMGGGPLVDNVKQSYARRRPYLDQPLPICEAKSDHLAGNGDYPSGHTTNGWARALLLAELLPDRSTQILARGRAMGESRYICGSHSKSAVEAGYMSGAALVATLHASADFRSDMEAARQELSAVRKSAKPASAPQCSFEQKALSLSR